MLVIAAEIAINLNTTIVFALLTHDSALSISCPPVQLGLIMLVLNLPRCYLQQWHGLEPAPTQSRPW